MSSIRGTDVSASSPTNTPRRGSKRPVLRFIAVFAAAIVIFYIVSSLPFFNDRFYPIYLRLNADASAWLLRLFGESATSTDAVVATPRFSLEIKRGCDAVEPIALYVAAILAFPATWKSRTLGIAFGSIGLLALNVVRIITLYYVGVHAPSFFESMHVGVWQVAFIIFVALTWIVWASWATSGRKPSGPKEPAPAAAA